MFNSDSDSDTGTGWSNLSFSNISFENMKDKTLWNVNDWDLVTTTPFKVFDVDKSQFYCEFNKHKSNNLVFKFKLLKGPPSKVGIKIEIIDQTNKDETTSRFRQIMFENNQEFYTFDTSISIETVDEMTYKNNLKILFQFTTSKIRNSKNNSAFAKIVQPPVRMSPLSKKVNKNEIQTANSPSKPTKSVNEPKNSDFEKRIKEIQLKLPYKAKETEQQVKIPSPLPQKEKIQKSNTDISKNTINKQGFQIKESIKDENESFEGFPKPFEDNDFPDTPKRETPKKIQNSPIYVSDSSSTTPAKTGFNGIINQGNTCYMNSYLQALFHIPAFRSLIYHIDTSDVKPREKSIPFSLQKLFASLQLGTSPASTKDLTRALGWSEFEIMEQHDIEEFATKLLDVLEAKLKGTKFQNAIADLFKGISTSIFDCTKIDFKSSTDNTFYDLQMTVQNIPSLRESFNLYTQAEDLVGESQYDTEIHGKQDAKYCTKFKHLPKVFCLLLNRFISDSRGTHKYNSKFEFETEIDLKQYMVENCDPKEETNYQLYGVLVHSGSSYAGHYYSYLKIADEWYKFNDTAVTRSTEEMAVKDNFGGPWYSTSLSYMSVITPSKEKPYSAYVLIYIRKDSFNELFYPISNDEIPDHVIKHESPISSPQHNPHFSFEDKEYYLISESSLKQNAKSYHQIDLHNTENAILMKVKPYLITIDEFIDEVATAVNMKPYEIRVWSINEETGRINSLITRSDDTADSLKEKTFFVEFVKDNEEIEYKTLFLSYFFSPRLSSPFTFMKKMLINASITTFDDLIVESRKILNLEDNVEMVVFYLTENGQLIQTDPSSIVSDSCKDNGTTLVFQCKNPLEAPLSKFELEISSDLESDDGFEVEPTKKPAFDISFSPGMNAIDIIKQINANRKH
ncbi:Clan CA, family C19, ubiquitin hydrolase-like cysteine peptidase [Trichomonas vaginalis G3]|uniref:Ubiquitin carboxyl-terminal hydrolase n=1 Tax=Trichomonas vaginalis (strain ATCC PRA-98 / G3) TaxID=412133 RepID=A2DHZ0_TRIV3|nr:ubiquitinyl hydrolase protein [Trichomonas vaginalis G3]EAY19979.1 Clan CA, family C19, ubiquitin hydrolase-like cysteine peptidase [Trichomonas vaginalis G3]KAI5525929.1 ubiquitinyl hydrolase protein [Trichomonas vaginalis G3]|eukprot:XP_001580965.1 Clan CA, family C19, ubiquitin hydrolase-like cysteine peptidase [Trichomonas vaginalis G3]